MPEFPGAPGANDANDAPGELLEFAERFVEETALPVLEAYTRIPCLSPDYDADWEAHGYLNEAARLLLEWVRSRPIPGLEAELVQLPGLTPVLVAEVPATPGYHGSDSPTLFYGHLDKQPPLGTWREGLAPFEPVRDGDRLYGRGTADDGYSVFAAIGAIDALGSADHPRCIVLIEATEESGSPHLPAYLEHLADRFGPAGPALVVCLDSGSPTYDRLWVTTSLRGLLQIDIRVDVLTEGVHSGSAGGVIPSSFRILRQLLSRIENEITGEIAVEECHTAIPEVRRREAGELVEVLGEHDVDNFPAVPGLHLGGETPAERVLNRTWRPALATVGMDGIPATADAGNVLRPFTHVKLAMRLPPSCDADRAAERVSERLSIVPPEGAAVEVKVEGAKGFDAPKMAEWLVGAVVGASEAYYGAPVGAAGEGGTIPFLSALQTKYPAAQFLVTGVLGPESNAHGPNEMLHLPTMKRVIASVAHVLASQP